jgi:hypothetical protein
MSKKLKWTKLEPKEEVRSIKFKTGELLELDEVTHMMKGETTIRLKCNQGIIIYNSKDVLYVRLKVKDLTI